MLNSVPRESIAEEGLMHNLTLTSDNFRCVVRHSVMYYIKCKVFKYQMSKFLINMQLSLFPKNEL